MIKGRKKVKRIQWHRKSEQCGERFERWTKGEKDSGAQGNNQPTLSLIDTKVQYRVELIQANWIHYCIDSFDLRYGVVDGKLNSHHITSTR